jgi:hypothetical protein
MALVNKRVFQAGFLILAAIFAIFWAILRARVQSLTIDEADTYLFFTSRELRWVWWPDSNNHVLNSVLMWLTIHVFGTSSSSVRAPALSGAILYIITCYLLCRYITNRFALQLSLFICLTYNPFVFDYLVAARGYSLALAFLIAAIAIPVSHAVDRGPSLGMSCALASLALGLSFTANFSFAFVDAAAFLGILAWAVTLSRTREPQPVFRILGFCVLPGLLVTLLICGYPLAHWKSGNLWYGSQSLSEMTKSLVEPSLYQLDPRFWNPSLYRAIGHLKPWLVPLLGILSLCQVLVTRLDGAWLQDARTRKMGRFAAALVGIAAFSLLLHWLAFHFVKLPLPRARTGIYLVPLVTLAGGVIAAVPARSLASQWFGRGLTVVFVCLACYFLLCLRLTYFEEWKWDADVKDVYPVLARYNHDYGVREVGTTWWYVATLNYYRAASNTETFLNFSAPTAEPPVDRSIYVLHGLFDRGFLDKQKLVVVYRGKSTDIVVAVRPDGPIPPIRIDP